MDENRIEEFDEGFDVSAPDDAGKTLKRLWSSVSDQHRRLLIVLVSVIFYTLLSIVAPLYSADIVDLLWEKIKASLAEGATFSITWNDGGREIFGLLIIYLATGLFYLFQSGVLILFTSVGMIAGSLVMMFRFSVLLTAVFLTFMGISLLVTKIVSAKTLRSALERQQRVSDVTALVEEGYSGRVIIKAFNQEGESSHKMHKATEELAEATRKADFMINAINPAIRFINRLGQILIAVLGGRMLLTGTMSVGVFQAFFQYVNQSAEPLTEMAFMVNSMQSSLASLERVYKLLDEEEISKDEEGVAPAGMAQGSVEFSHVKFGYSKDTTLMKDVSFKARPGQKIAIVGSTGAGKTTLINLLMRFYETDGGQIFLDGRDTRSISRAALRKNFGMVLQDTWLFEGTIAENIAYGKPEATREEIVAAAKAARVDFFVHTMPLGYDTVLSNDAENISVGQRQLLTIARVFLCDPAVLILDEATSSVDTRTEAEISKAMGRLMKGRTSFVIAHRLSTIVDADMILFMQEGNIIEQGDHRSLLAAGGAYADLYNSQFA